MDAACRQQGGENMFGGIQFAGLVPFADLMNHSHAPNVAWAWDESTGQFVMRVVGHPAAEDPELQVGVAAGAELTIDYSPGHSGQDPREQHPAW